MGCLEGKEGVRDYPELPYHATVSLVERVGEEPIWVCGYAFWLESARVAALEQDAGAPGLLLFGALGTMTSERSS